MRNIIKFSEWIAMCVLLIGCGSAGNEEYLLSTQTAGVEAERETEAGKPSDTLVVYVCGEVPSPGVYELPVGSRICDALEAAGGLTEQGAPDYWNLAEPLTDGEMLRFPTREEAKEWKEASEADGEASDGRVNLNAATKEQLMALPGIGEARADAILAYRSEHGSFLSVEDLKQVSGIGNAIFERVRESITVD